MSDGEPLSGREGPSEDGVIAPMVEGDLPQVLAIEQQSFDDPWPEQVFRSEFRHSWSHQKVLRAKDGRVLGYVVFWQVSDELRLLNVAVDPRVRHHHHGRILLDQVRTYGEQNGCRFISTEMRRGNAAGRAMMAHYGFKQVGVRPGREGGEDDSLESEDTLVLLYDMGSTSEVGPLPGA
jgi:ribosomal-protein-alanine N-acetyltransferase